MALRFGGRRLDPLDLLLIVEFSVISIGYFLPILLRGPAIDAVAYWGAATTWLAGGDPYAMHGGLLFAAPPPTLGVLAPFALLPLPTFSLLMFAGNLAAACFIVLRLRLPFWFLLFPPIVEALSSGNPNVMVLALLLAAKPVADVVASFVKLYALIPVVLLGRRSALLVIGALVVTAPFLPWGSFVSHAADIATVLSVQSSGGRSALAFPVLIPITIVALLLIGRQRAAWLFVPALWPATQFHYSVLAMPAMTRLMAAIFAIPLPGAPAVAVIVGAVAELIERRRAAAATLGGATRPSTAGTID